jgi:hypothetical protein
MLNRFEISALALLTTSLAHTVRLFDSAGGGIRGVLIWVDSLGNCTQMDVGYEI